LAWVGGLGANSSGDLFLAFSTAAHIHDDTRVHQIEMLSPDEMTSLFQATAEATEEAILNALAMATTMTGLGNRTAHALPLDVIRSMVLT
jgi:D-aminopeptidase